MSPEGLQCIWKSGHVQWEPKMGNPEVQTFHSLIFLVVKGRAEHITVMGTMGFQIC